MERLLRADNALGSNFHDGLTCRMVVVIDVIALGQGPRVTGSEVDLAPRIDGGRGRSSHYSPQVGTGFSTPVKMPFFPLGKAAAPPFRSLTVHKWSNHCDLRCMKDFNPGPM
jgi:hypothetical protein